MLDPSVLGTPIGALQIPDSVKAQISVDLSAGAASTLFTQDDHSIDDTRADLPPGDAALLEARDIQVGWACPGCANVFQQERALAAHQKVRGTDYVVDISSL